MKQLIVTLFAAVMALSASVAQAAGPAVPLDKANYDLRDKASLQSGAKLYMNYCFACHATGYQRYSRVADDLGISEDLMMENLVFTDAKYGDLMQNAMPKADAEKWFGAAPPDLTMVARVRGADWLYTYLRSFYADPSRPFGVNNLVFPMVGMPHVLEELQGSTELIYREEDHDGEVVQVPDRIESRGNGELSAEEYDQAVLDLVNFLVYSAEPMKLERQRLGYWVIGFLLILMVFAYFLNKEYWRDIH